MKDGNLELAPLSQMETFLASAAEVYSHSEIDTFQRCRRKWYYEYVLRLGSPAPAVAADVGNVIHAGLAELYRTGDLDAALAVQTREHTRLFAWVDGAGYDLATQYELSHLNKVLVDYAIRVYRHEDLVPLGPNYVEVGFIIELDGAYLYGRIDYIGEHNKLLHVAALDHKSTKSFGKDFAAKYDPDAQGDTYTYVVRKLFPTREVPGFYVNGLLLQVKTIDFNRILVPKRAVTVAEWELETKWWINEIRRARAEAFYPKSTNQCTAFGGCSFRVACTSHMLPNVLDSFPKRSSRGFHFTEES